MGLLTRRDTNLLFTAADTVISMFEGSIVDALSVMRVIVYHVIEELVCEHIWLYYLLKSLPLHVSRALRDKASIT